MGHSRPVNRQRDQSNRAPDAAMEAPRGASIVSWTLRLVRGESGGGNEDRTSEAVLLRRPLIGAATGLVESVLGQLGDAAEFPNLG